MPPGKATAQIRADGVPLKDAVEREIDIETNGIVDFGTVKLPLRESATVSP